MTLDGSLAVTPKGEGVAFVFMVTNNDDAPVELEFRSGKPADITVFRDGEVVWRWGENRMFTQAVWAETLAPDESLTHDALWERPPPGTYRAEAVLAATHHSVTATADFEV